MSGGSYNYLARELDINGAEGIMTRQDDLLRMAHALEHHCPEAAEETRLFLRGGPVEQQHRSLLHQVERHAERLGPLWHAVEWYTSNGWSRDQVDAAVAEYRAKPPVESPDVHQDCFRVVDGLDALVYFGQASGGRRITTLSVGLYPPPPFDVLFSGYSSVELRFLLVRLEVAKEAAEAALDRANTTLTIRTAGGDSYEVPGGR